MIGFALPGAGRFKTIYYSNSKIVAPSNMSIKPNNGRSKPPSTKNCCWKCVSSRAKNTMKTRT